MMEEDANCGTRELPQKEHRTTADKDVDDANSISRQSSTKYSMPSVPEGNSDGDDALCFTWEQKRHMVERVKTREGPLACHVLQGHIQSYISICAASASRGDRPADMHMEEWLQSILASILDCLGQARGRLTFAVGELRSATFLLQLCSTILKTQRGDSHPERASSTPLPQLHDRRTTHGTGREAEPFGTGSSTCHDGDRLAAQVCAGLASPYLGKMVRVASVLMLEDISGTDDVGYARGRHAGADAVFWVLSFLSDVLKHLRKTQWRCRVSVASSSLDSGSRHEVGATDVPREASKDVPAAGCEGDASSSARGVSDEVVANALGLTELVEAFSAVPVGRGPGAPDVALKWLEIAQLLMDAAEPSWRDTMPILMASIPPALWRLTDDTGSLLPRQQSVRPPGSAFVEEDGANDAISQAALSMVFRVVRLCGERGLFGAQGCDAAKLIRNNSVAEPSEKGKDAIDMRYGGAGRAWSTIVDALVATATDTRCPSVGGRESHLDFCRRLVRLFGDQDDALVDMLLTNLDIFLQARAQKAPVGDAQHSGRRIQQFPRALQMLYGGQLHPATLFAALLSEVRFDSSVLLDWLISPETTFLQYLTLLLRVAVAEWPEFAANISGARLSAAGIGSGERVLGGMEDGDEAEEEEELVLSEEEAESLSSVVSCLSGLVSIARGLERSRLVPYNVAPLLRRIEQVVLLYEDCGDAHEEEQDLQEMSVDNTVGGGCSDRMQ